jgi:RNA polymerase sigma factor (sigma-70 family)
MNFLTASMTVRQTEMAKLRSELVGYLQRRGQTLDDAEDVVQETFARFHRAGHQAGDADARPLLFTISKNLLRDQWKAANRERGRASRLDPNILDLAREAVASDAPGQDREAIARQELAEAAAVIRALPPRCRDAFLLHRFEDLTYRQIAQRLGVSVSMVEKHLAEALRRLKAARDLR